MADQHKHNDVHQDGAAVDAAASDSAPASASAPAPDAAAEKAGGDMPDIEDGDLGVATEENDNDKLTQNVDEKMQELDLNAPGVRQQQQQQQQQQDPASASAAGPSSPESAGQDSVAAPETTEDETARPQTQSHDHPYGDDQGGYSRPSTPGTATDMDTSQDQTYDSRMDHTDADDDSDGDGEDTPHASSSNQLAESVNAQAQDEKGTVSQSEPFPTVVTESETITADTPDTQPGHEHEKEHDHASDAPTSSPAPPRSTSEYRSPPSDSRPRSDSRSTTMTTATRSSAAHPLTSAVFILTALDTIAQNKEAKRNPELEKAVEEARQNIKNANEAHPIDPEVIFKPLQMATKLLSVQVQVAALGCIGTLITYSYFAFPSSTTAAVSPAQPQEGQPHPQPPTEPVPLIERAIETICDCFENESTPPEIQQQIIKSLLAAVLNDKIVVHGAGLLKAVRQIYNIFIYSKDNQNQQIAQGSLTQMVGTVFDRVKGRLELKEHRMREKGAAASIELGVPGDGDEHGGMGMSAVGEADATETSPADDETDDNADQANADSEKAQPPQEKMTLESFETQQGRDEAISDDAPTMVTRARSRRTKSLLVNTHLHPSSPGSPASVAVNAGEDSQAAIDDEIDEIYFKDAFLVFRAMCKLSHKVLSHEQQQDLKSQNMRTKLLSLHLIQHLLAQYISVFMSTSTLIKSGAEKTGKNEKEKDRGITLLQAVKPHLCLSLSRNGASAVPRVYEICCEIFWLMLKNMRVMLKKEIEVFLKEVYLAILEKRNSPMFQKQGFMDILHRLAVDPRALVEIYLNYDCDRTALENMFQSLIEHLSRLSSMPVQVTPQQEAAYQEQHLKTAGTTAAVGSLLTRTDSLPPSLTTARMVGTAANGALLAQPGITINNVLVPQEYILKQRASECLTGILRSLSDWTNTKPTRTVSADHRGNSISVSRGSYDVPRESMDTNVMLSPRLEAISVSNLEVGGASSTGALTPLVEDDPNEIEKVKQRKIALSNAIRTFNFKPKRGMKMFLKEGFIRSEDPQEIAGFLIRNDRLNKAALGEYLGEGDAENIAIMHAFVDFMDFTKRPFVEALRHFLQSFRLPGESQKIDRFMLKFAERYLTNNPGAFKTADAPYILAYSVIMLNTDLHSSKFKGRRMTKEDFISNNRGINDNSDLPPEFLGAIYDDIASDEIVLYAEREAAANLGIPTQPPPTLASRAGQALASVGRDIEMEKFSQASEEISNKTEQLYRSLIRAQRRFSLKDSTFSKFIPATSVQHVGSMFNVTWMSFLSGLSAPIQETQNLDAIKLAMEGLRFAIHISCIFDLETPREAFVSALSKFTNLNNLREMVAKNVEALKVLLDVAIMEGNYLKSSWRDILTCISQLDRLQLLTDGVDEETIPDPSFARVSTDLRGRKSTQNRRSRTTNGFRMDVAMESRSIDMVKTVDRIFTNTATLSSEAIVDFVRALSIVSWQEIQSSGASDSPRTFSLQKVVEISYYNMTRVRIEWTRIWEVLGQHFNQVGCHNNTNVVFFALDSLRQLSMRFMEIGELPGFKFQKDFLKPFEHVMANTGAVPVKDMVLRCLSQMIQARGDNIRSGWKTMFGVFTVAAKERYESLVNMAFEHVSSIYKTRFGTVITQGAFTDFIVCLTEFSKNLKFQKKSLQAIETLKTTAPKMLKTPECPLCQTAEKIENPENSNLAMQPGQSPEEQFWYPLLIAFQDVLMTGDDLEVRSRALTYLFDTLIDYGGDFSQEFWDVLWRQLLYPIFVVLQSKSEMSKVPNHEELSVWLSTTMIQALRNMISLFTHYFEALRYMLDRLLGLLTLCICQENDTIARIGSNCLQRLILENVNKFESDDWSKIVGAFVDLFERTTAYDLFTAASTDSEGKQDRRNSADTTASSHNDLSDQEQRHRSNGASQLGTSDDASAPSSENPDVVTAEHSRTSQPPPQMTPARRRFFNRIITNCVLQLLMIETVNELFSNESVFTLIPSDELLRLMTLLKKSYQFAKRFNEAKELRVQLWRQGFMKQPPNLLKQESGSASTYVNILFRMYDDENPERKASRAVTEAALVPLCADILRSFIALDEDSQQRNIAAWRPVVIDVLEGFTNFPTETFEKYIDSFYPLTIGLLCRDFPGDIRVALYGMLKRVGVCRLNTPETLPFEEPRNETLQGRRGGSIQASGR